MHAFITKLKAELKRLSYARKKTAHRAKFRGELKLFLSSPASLALPTNARPKVSILIVTWNQAELTYACLRGLEKNVSVSYEVIIVDNASTDLTAELLGRIKGAKVVNNKENVGFLRAVNAGAGLAVGEHMLLLNNDAVVRAGSLEAAVSTLEGDHGIGAVGGALILLDGSLQEAGSIVWRDGSCLGYGRGRNKDEAEFKFRRDVDYCSGAFLLIKLPLWRQLGGFDETFAPAYYEESDLCMRLRAAGFRVVYEPNAVIDHYEFGSAAKPEWALDLQRKNSRIFSEKHHIQLQEHLPPSEDNILLARIASRTAKRILVVDDAVPYAFLGSGYPRSAAILRGLVKIGMQVTFFSTTTLQKLDWQEIYAAIPPAVEVVLDHGRHQLVDFLASRKDYYDIVFVSRPHNMAPLHAALSRDRGFLGHSSLVYDAEALFSVRERLKAKVSGMALSDEAASEKLRAEIGLTDYADMVVAVSSQEAQAFLDSGRVNVRILGHSLSIAASNKTWGERSGILFVGRLMEADSPNTDSMLWVVEHVYPLIEAELGSIDLLVVGKNGAPPIKSLPEKNGRVRLLGMVPDLAPIYERARVVIVPTRYAAGIPFKAHEAAAYGVPIVSTSLIAKQLGWTSGESILTADDPQSFAATVAQLYRDELLWNSIREAARKLAMTECSSEAFENSLEDIVSSVPSKPRPS